MRKTMFGHLTAQVTLTTIVPAARWYAPGAVVDSPVKPFVIVRWISPVPGAFTGAFLRQLRVEVHENRGDYSKNDAFSSAIKPIMAAIQQLVGPDGRITQSDFLGEGGDQENADYGTNFGFTSWQVIGATS